MRLKAKSLLWLSLIVFLELIALKPISAADHADESMLSLSRLFGTGEFDADRLPGMRWSRRGSFYYTLENGSGSAGQSLVRNDPATGRKTVIIEAGDLIPEGSKSPISIDDYEFSSDESRLLIFTNSQRVWRRNTRGDYWVIDLKTRKLQKLGGSSPPSSLLFATFSPDGSKVAYVCENNLHVQNLLNQKITKLTSDGSDTIINGTSDWVNEEELDLRNCFRWSPDGRRLLYWQFDTSGVAQFHLVNNTTSKTPKITSFAYPKVGGKNSATRLGVVSADGGKTQWLELPGDPREHYIPHADWAPDGSQILVEQFNRLQNQLQVFKVDPQSLAAKSILIEQDEAWLENENPWRWIQSGKGLLWISERSGWRHAYQASVDGGDLKPITSGDFDLIEIEAIDQAGGWLYFAASPKNATQRHLFRRRLDGSGSQEQISPASSSGWHEYDISPDGQWAVHTFSNMTTPPVVELVRLKDLIVVRTLIDNSRLRAKLAKLNKPEIEFMQIPIEGGILLDAWSMKPAKRAPGSKLPLLMHVYGEPHGQTVRDAWPGRRGLWHWMLAQQGFVVASVDNRGTNVPRGRAWRKAVHRQIGILASKEQASAVEALLKRWDFVDQGRVGSWGWSGGGSMSLNAIFRYPDLYRTAIAVAPVADQTLYDTIYQERYMGLPDSNAVGYRNGSPISHASKLRGNLLIIHGTGDDNCHYQGTERLMDELIAAGKRFSVLPYPNRSHSISEGQNTDRHLMETMTRFLMDNLLSENAPEPEPVYESETILGWKVYINRRLMQSNARQTRNAIALLKKQLETITRMIPEGPLRKIQQVPLYFNPEYSGVRPTAEYHPGAGWLKDNGRDPAMAKGVEFTNIRIYEAEVNRMPAFVLHELAHAYHDRELPGGFGHKGIAAAFKLAQQSGKYNAVKRHFGNGRPETIEKAYAMTSPMEYFAESTEAYFSRNDFYPFTKSELQQHDLEIYQLIANLWEAEPNAKSADNDKLTLTEQLLKESPADLARAARQQGDASRGAQIFHQPSLACAKCHESGTNNQFLPDISKAGKETTAEYLIESVLLPSKVIKKGFEPLILVTKQGQTFSGLKFEETREYITLVEPVSGSKSKISKAEIDERSSSSQSIMPDGLVNLLSERQQFLDLARYLIEVAEGGSKRADELRPPSVTFVTPDYEKEIDHAGLIQSLDEKAFKRGEAIYARVCANCHGTKETPGSLPNSPRFASHVFKNGSDPYSLYRTISQGYNLMPPQNWMVPRQKYDVIYYLRESYLRPNNPSQYKKVDSEYLAELPAGKKGEFGPQPAKVDPWIAMDYGPSLMNTYEIGGPGPNIAYKGIAIRLDSGAGGVSRGRSWALFDHDTMRFAAAWTGDGFIDWKGIHFNGQHQIHPKLTGERHIVNPVGPGWADPQSGSFKDPRILGRDGRPTGPLPARWSQFKGTYSFGDLTIIRYTVGEAEILELDGVEAGVNNQPIFTRTLEVGKSTQDLIARIAPAENYVSVVGNSKVSIEIRDGFQTLKIPSSTTPTIVKVFISKAGAVTANFKSNPPQPLISFIKGGPRRWPVAVKTSVSIGSSSGPFALDTFGLPVQNPWNALVRLTGFDFMPDGRSMAVCSWDGDVWMVSGIDHPESGLTWQRIASGLFQPLGLKIRDGEIFVCCRDQIVRLKDFNGDGETDFYDCFNNDHQVTEHFHEFAMGLQTDDEGNFYYAKSGRHALPALVPHHGTLLKVSKDGRSTEIIATGFRAANGVCLNPDGTFFVTDQEGFWTPKNRINLVEKGGFYGNMWGYTNITDTSDSAMKQPLCWITNEFDRSPAELVWIPPNTWGPLAGSLLNTSYGMGKLYIVPFEKIKGQAQGGVSPLPLPTLPTGIMRPRFQPDTGDLYACGMFAWAGNQTQPGGFYRVRYTGKPADLPVKIHAKTGAIELTFSDTIDRESLNLDHFQIKAWDLKRSQNYGSKHINERSLAVTRVTGLENRKTVRLEIPELAPSRGMEIKYQFKGADGHPVSGVIHHTIHQLSD